MPRNELFDYMASATKQMAERYELIRRRRAEDPGTAGDRGEENWAELLRDWLPGYFHVVTKGRILNHEGQTSPQTDVLVLSPSYPKQLLNEKLYLAGGVEAAFECKTTLEPHHIDKAVRTASEIRKLLPERKGTPYKEMHSSITYGLLAHSHTWKSPNSTPHENVKNNLLQSEQSYTNHPREMLDLLCIADLTTWSTMKGVRWPVQDPNNPTKIVGWLPATMYFGPVTESETQAGVFGGVEGYTPIGKLLTQLMEHLAWEYQDMRELAKYFTRSNIGGGGIGRPRFWNYDIFSEALQKKMPGNLDELTPWSEWNPMFK
jgi:hypothetical protein